MLMMSSFYGERKQYAQNLSTKLMGLFIFVKVEYIPTTPWTRYKYTQYTVKMTTNNLQGHLFYTKEPLSKQ